MGCKGSRVRIPPRRPKTHRARSFTTPGFFVFCVQCWRENLYKSMRYECLDPSSFPVLIDPALPLSGHRWLELCDNSATKRCCGKSFSSPWTHSSPRPQRRADRLQTQDAADFNRFGRCVFVLSKEPQAHRSEVMGTSTYLHPQLQAQPDFVGPLPEVDLVTGVFR